MQLRHPAKAMTVRRIVGAVALATIGAGCAGGASTAAGTPSTPVAPAGPAVACGSMNLSNLATGQLAAPDGSPLMTSASLGTIRATLSGVATMAGPPLHQPVLAGATIRVFVRGKQALADSVGTPGLPSGAPLVLGSIGPTGVPIWSNYAEGTALNGTDSQVPLCVARFGGTHPQTAVLVGLYTGGNHCCTWLYAFPVGSNSVSRTPLKYLVGNPDAGVVDDGGHAVIVTGDNAFDYEFASFAGSGTPVMALEVRGGRFVTTTDEHLDWVAADSGYWWGLFSASQQGQGLGVLAAWAADECALGHGSQAFESLARLGAKEQLNSSLNLWPSGPAYLAQLRSFLSAHGYCAHGSTGS